MRARTVLQYLRDNPKFLRTHQSELTRMLRLAERDVVDLTGKQLVVLRDENTILRRQLGVWYQNAADNEQIMFFLHRLAVKLAGQPLSAGSTAKHLAALLKKHLQIPLCRLVPLTGDDRVELSSNDRRRLVDCAGALRSITPLASFRWAGRHEKMESVVARAGVIQTQVDSLYPVCISRCQAVSAHCAL